MERIQGLTIDLALDTTALNRGLTGLKDKLRSVNAEMKANMSSFDRNDRSVSKYETRLNGLNRKLEVQREVTKAAKEQYERLVQEHGEGSKQADKAAASYNREVAALNNLDRYIGNTREELERLREEQRIAESGWGRLSQRMEAVGSRLTTVGDSMKNAGKSMSMYLTAPIAGLGVATVKTAADFEEGMDRVAAISGATGQDFTKLRDLAKKLGAETKFSATEAASGMEFLSMAGFKTNDILAAMPGMLDLAAAGALELGAAADITSNIMSGFGVAAEESGHVADVLAKAASNANTDVTQMGEAMKYLAPAAKVLGWGVEESAAAVMAFGDAGIQGTLAGQAFATSLTRLAKNPTKKMKKALDELNFSFFDAEGTMKSMPEIIKGLETNMKGWTDKQKAATITTIFGAEAFKHWAVLIDKGSDALGKNTKMLENADGASKKMAKTMSDNTKGSFKTFLSSIEGLAIQLGDILLPIVNNVVKKLTEWTRKFAALNPETQKTILAVAGIAAAIGPLLVVMGTLISSVGTIVSAFGAVSGAIAAAGGASAVLGTAFAALTGPIGLAVAAIAALTVGGIALYKHFQKDAIPEVDRFGDSVSKSTKKALGSYFDLSDGASQKLTEMSLTQQKVTKETKDALVNTYSEMNKKILKKMDERHNKQMEKSRNFFLHSHILTQEEEEKILRDQEMKNQAEVAGQEYKEKRIKEILEKASSEKRALTSSEKTEINSLQEQMNENAVQYLSKNELEAKVIMERMKQSAGDLSAKQAAEVVANSNKQKNKAVKAAEEQYDKTVAEIIRMRDETGVISADQANRMIKEAGRQKDVTVGRAEETHKEVVGAAKAQAGEHLDTVNWETGKVLSKWEVFKNNTSKKWNEIKTNTSKKWNEMKNDVVKKATDLKNNAVTKFNELRTQGKEKFENLRHNVVSLAEKAKSGAVNKFESFKTKVTEIFGGIKNKVKGYVTDMVDAVKNMPGKMGAGLKNMAGKAVDGVKSLGNKMSGKLESIVNGITQDGINAVLKKLGVDSKYLIPKLDIPEYAKGTDGHKGGLAILGDGGQRELFITPDGKTGLSPATDTLMNLPKGTQVLSGENTKRALGNVPKYKEGEGFWNDLWSYISSPKKLLSKVWDTLNLPELDIDGAFGRIGKGAISSIKDNAVGFIKGKMEDLFSFGGGDSSSVPSAGSGVQRWAGLATRALMIEGQYSKANLDRLLYQMQTESGGNPRAINLWDINAKRGTPSMGLLQTIMPTYQAYKHPQFDKGPYDPMSNILASIRYAMARYGSLARAYRGVGYASGGLINKDGLYRLAEGGFPEFVIPTDPARRTDAMKLLALAGKQINGNKRPNQLPGIGSSGNNGSLEIVIDKLSQQVQLLTELVLSSRNIENKPVLSEGDIGRAAERYDAGQSIKNKIFKGRGSY